MCSLYRKLQIKRSFENLIYVSVRRLQNPVTFTYTPWQALL